MSIRSALANVYRSNKLTVWMLTGVAFGVIIGLILQSFLSRPVHSRLVMYIGFLGDIFIGLLRAVSLPLVVSCLVNAFGTLDREMTAAVGGKFVMYMLMQKVFSSVVASFLVLTIRPGGGGESDGGGTLPLPSVAKNLTTIDTFLDMLRNAIPTNTIAMCIFMYETKLLPPENVSMPLTEWKIAEGGDVVDAMNMLGVVHLSILFGAVFAYMHTSANQLVEVFGAIMKVIFIMFNWIMLMSPVLLASLVAGQLVQVDDFAKLATDFGLYIATVYVGYITVSIVINALVFFILTRRNPFMIFSHASDTFVTTLATASSLASIPITINCMERKGDYDPKLVQFVIPIAHAINKDGAVIYLTITTIFLAQLNNVPVTIDKVIGVVLMSVMSSVALAGVPLTSVMVLTVFLQSMQIPTHQVGMLIAIDWLMDRGQTMTNCVDDVFIVGLIHYRSKRNTGEGNAVQQAT